MKDLLTAVGLFAAGLGITLAYPLDLPGRIRLGELVLMALTPIAFGWFKEIAANYKRHLNKILFALGGLLAWHVFTDLMQGVSQDKTIDVAATLVFSGIKLFVLASLFLRYPAAVTPWLVGSAIGNFFLADEIKTSKAIIQNEYWDLRVAHWASPLLMAYIIIVGKKSLLMVFAGTLLYGLAAAFYGARSHGMTMIIAATLPYGLSFANEMRLVRGQKSIWKVAAICCLGGAIMSIVYVQAARAGLVTRKSQEQLSQIKNPYNPIELVWSGRAGTLIGIEGALERPVFGFGSMQFHFPKYGISMRNDAWQVIHSMVAESLVYAGFVTLIFWFLISKEMLEIYPPIPANRHMLNGYYFLATILIVGAYWAFLFSPLVSARFTIPTFVSLLLYCNQSIAKPYRNQN